MSFRRRAAQTPHPQFDLGNLETGPVVSELEEEERQSAAAEEEEISSRRDSVSVSVYEAPTGRADDESSEDEGAGTTCLVA